MIYFYISCLISFLLCTTGAMASRASGRKKTAASDLPQRDYEFGDGASYSGQYSTAGGSVARAGERRKTKEAEEEKKKKKKRRREEDGEEERKEK